MRVDFNDEASLLNALKGQQFLVITLSIKAPRDTCGKLLRAAAAAGVPYVLPNWFGADPLNETLVNETQLGEMRRQQREEVEGHGVSAWIALACSFWYEYSLAGGPQRYGFDMKNRKVILFDEGTVAINTTTLPQCGRAVAGLLSLRELPEDENDTSPTVSQFTNSGLRISSFRVSQQDMFESVKRVTHTTDKDWKITKEPAMERYLAGVTAMKQGDIKGFAQQLYTRTFFSDSNGDHESTNGLHNNLLGLPKEDLDEFTREAMVLAEQGGVEI